MSVFRAELDAPWALTAPLFRCLVLRLSEGHALVGLLMSHAIADGYALRVVVSDFIELYRAAVAHDTPKLSSPSLRYAECIRSRSAPADQRREAYWREMFSRPAIPVVYPRAARRGEIPDAAWRDRPIPPVEAAVTRGLIRRAKLAKASLATALLACAVAAVRPYARGEVVVAFAVGRRTSAEQAVVGWLADVLLLRVDVERVDGCLDLLARARAAQRGAYDHAVPLDAIAPDGLTGESGPGRPAHADVSLNFDLYRALPRVTGKDRAGRPLRLEGVRIVGGPRVHNFVKPLRMAPPGFLLRADDRENIDGWIGAHGTTLDDEAVRRLATGFHTAAERIAGS